MPLLQTWTGTSSDGEAVFVLSGLTLAAYVACVAVRVGIRGSGGRSAAQEVNPDREPREGVPGSGIARILRRQMPAESPATTGERMAADATARKARIAERPEEYGTLLLILLTILFVVLSLQWISLAGIAGYLMFLVVESRKKSSECRGYGPRSRADKSLRRQKS